MPKRKDAVPTATEAKFVSQVVALAKMLQWEVFHPWLSIHSARGWPDLALVKVDTDTGVGRLILAECKSETGKLTASQERWLSLLRKVPGIEVAVWRPSQLDEIAIVLGAELKR